MRDGLEHVVTGRPPTVLALRRAWIRATDHLLLEYVDDAGRIAPGQWFRDEARARRIETATSAAAPEGAVTRVAAAGGTVLIQREGADRRLVGLAPLLARPDASLRSHRPERRAVVFLDGAPSRYAKVVRPSRLPALLAPARCIAASATEFDVPRILKSDADAGVVIFSALDGPVLFDRPDDEAAWRAAGRSLRHLHELPPAGAARHDADDEIELLRTRAGDLAVIDPAAHRAVAAALPGVLAGLATTPGPTATIHRDFYDKQIVLGPDGRLGLLDLDTVADGDPALDLANALVHLELRVLQERLGAGAADRATGALLTGYDADPATAARLGAYADATRFRLACLYALRPRWRHLVPALAERIGARCPGLAARDIEGVGS